MDRGFKNGKPERLFCNTTTRRSIFAFGPSDLIWTAELESGGGKKTWLAGTVAGAMVRHGQDKARRRSKETALEATIFDEEATGEERRSRRAHLGHWWGPPSTGDGARLGEADCERRR